MNDNTQIALSIFLSMIPGFIAGVYAKLNGYSSRVALLVLLPAILTPVILLGSLISGFLLLIKLGKMAGMITSEASPAAAEGAGGAFIFILFVGLLLVGALAAFASYSMVTENYSRK